MDSKKPFNGFTMYCYSAIRDEPDPNFWMRLEPIWLDLTENSGQILSGWTGFFQQENAKKKKW